MCTQYQKREKSVVSVKRGKICTPCQARVNALGVKHDVLHVLGFKRRKKLTRGKSVKIHQRNEDSLCMRVE